MANDKESGVGHQEISTEEKATIYQNELTVDEKGNQTVVDYSGAHEKTDPREIALVRKLDWYIMPTLWVMYWLNYLDRNAIALAKIDDIDEHLGLDDSQYQTCVSILFVGYILGQIPSNMLITRLRPSYYMAGSMMLWALVSCLTALAKDFKGLLLTRFFLGVVEVSCEMMLPVPEDK